MNNNETNNNETNNNETNNNETNNNETNNNNLNNIISIFIKKLYKIIDYNDDIVNNLNPNPNLNQNPADNISETSIKKLEKNELTRIVKTDKKFLVTILLIDKLIDSLIDICIKNKIYYFIKNNISYTHIRSGFKLHLTEYLHDIIYKDNTYIDQYFKEIKNDDLDNFSDINSIFLYKYKNQDAKVSFNVNIIEYVYDTNNKLKDKVLDNKDKSSTQLLKYDKLDDNYSTNSTNSIDSNKSSKSSKSSIKSGTKLEHLVRENYIKSYEKKNKVLINKNMDIDNELSIDNRLAMYIQLILKESKNILEFIEKLTEMCMVLYDINIEYNTNKPFTFCVEK